jgi:predicted ATPase/class 3 adenylate cyclase
MHRLVPPFILEKYRQGQNMGALACAGLFVDLSGFSDMTDALAQHGRAGAEALTNVMRGLFDPFVRAVYSQGGIVVGFAGDAFTAVFPEDRPNGPALTRCLSAVRTMQDRVRTHPNIVTPYGIFPINVKAGLALGEAVWQIFKSADGKRATYCFRGPGVDGAIAAEGCARPGDIIVDSSALARIRDMVEVELTGECYRLLRVFGDLPSPASFSDPVPDPDLLGVFCPESILHMPMTGEFRQVVNMFIDIPVEMYVDPPLAPFMERVFELQDRYGGYFLRPDLGDKGFNLLMFWGAPLAHETDVERALAFILDLSADMQMPIRAGVSYKYAFAGFIGSDLREEYTAYGWGVNLAARLMGSAAPGEIRLDGETARRAEKRFDVKFLEESNFKGFVQKQKVFSLLGRKSLVEMVYQGKLVGRDGELARLEEFVSPLWRGEFPGAMIVRGDAGIGKSRLVHSFQISSAFDSNPAKWIVCQTDEILRQPLNPFMDWLRKEFRVADFDSNDAAWMGFHERLKEKINAIPDPDLASELERTSSVLAALLDLRQPDSLYEQLDAKGRHENTFIALSALLRAECLKTPLIIFIEDAHWLDDETRAFLPYFVRTIQADSAKNYPIAILATQRPGAEFLDLGDDVIRAKLDLDRLPPADLSDLAEAALGKPISASLLALLEERSDGNPFFAEQILHYISENGLLALRQDGRYDAVTRLEEALPIDVRAILIARLDGLTSEAREAVQTASVLGREFEVRLLAAMMREEVDLTHKIRLAEDAGVWFALNGMQYIFRHALLREAAYSMQLIARQAELHARAVGAMETVYADELSAHYGEIAYHAERAGLIEKARYYLALAGRTAADAYQNSLAVDYFTRALDLTPENELRRKFDLLRERAEVFNRMGDRDAQAGDLEALTELSERLDDNVCKTCVHVMRADYAFNVSDFSLAVDYAKRAAQLAQAGGEDEQALDGYRVWPLALLRQGRLEEAMIQAQEGLDLARRLGKKLEEGNILNSMGLIALELKEQAQARNYFEEALEIARAASNRSLETKSLNNLGNAAGIQGDYLAARDYYERAGLISHERGDRSHEGIVLGNLGWVAGMQGDFDAARSYHEQALSIAREVGNRFQETYVLINLSAVACVRKETDAAVQFAMQALDLARRINDRSGEAWALLYLGHAYLMNGELEPAQGAFLGSAEIRDELNQASLKMEAVAGLVQVALDANDPLRALGEAETILAHLAGGGSFEGAEEPLRIYLACFRALEKNRDPRAASVLSEAVKLLQSQTALLRDEESRLRYVENVPWRKEIAELQKKKNFGSQGDIRSSE